MIQDPLAMLAFALILSLGVERFLEIVRASEKYYEAKHPHLSKWNDRAIKIQRNLQGLLDNQKPDTFNPLLLFFSHHLVYKKTERGSALVVSANAVRSTLTRAQYKILAVSCGILLALIFQINVFRLVGQVGQEALWLDSFIARDSLTNLGTILTGIAIGFGSGPLHDIIVALERARSNKIKVEQE